MPVSSRPPSFRSGPRSYSEASASVILPDMSHPLDYHFRPLSSRRYYRRRQRCPRPYADFLDDLLPEAPPADPAEPDIANGIGTTPDLTLAAVSAAAATGKPVIAASGVAPQSAETPQPPIIVTVDPLQTDPAPTDLEHANGHYAAAVDQGVESAPGANRPPHVAFAPTEDTIQQVEETAPAVLDDLQNTWRPNFPNIPPTFNPLQAYYSAPNRGHAPYALPRAGRVRPAVAAPTPGPVYPTGYMFRLSTQPLGEGASGRHPDPLPDMTLLDGMTGIPVLTCSRQSVSRLLGVVKDPATQVPALFISLCMMSPTQAFLLATNAAAAPVFTAGVWLPAISGRHDLAQMGNSHFVDKQGRVTVVECVSGDVWDCGRGVVRFKDELQMETNQNGAQKDEIMRRRKRRWQWARRVMRVVSSPDGKIEWVVGASGEILATFVGKPKKSRRRNGMGYSSSRGDPNKDFKWSLNVAPGVDVGVVLASLFCQTCAIALTPNENEEVNMDARTNVNTNLGV